MRDFEAEESSAYARACVRACLVWKGGAGRERDFAGTTRSLAGLSKGTDLTPGKKEGTTGAPGWLDGLGLRLPLGSGRFHGWWVPARSPALC